MFRILFPRIQDDNVAAAGDQVLHSAGRPIPSVNSIISFPYIRISSLDTQPTRTTRRGVKGQHTCLSQLVETHSRYKYPYVYHFKVFLSSHHQCLRHQLGLPYFKDTDSLFSLLHIIPAIPLSIMQLTVFVATLLASVVSARSFTLYDDVNFGGAAHSENRNNDAACCMRLLLLTIRKSIIDKP